MHRPSPVAIHISPPGPQRDARTFRGALHPSQPVRPRQNHALHRATSHALHPHHPQTQTPWPLEAMGHSHMSGHTPAIFRLSNGEFNLTQIASVTHPPFGVGLGLLSTDHNHLNPQGPNPPQPQRLHSANKWSAKTVKATGLTNATYGLTCEKNDLTLRPLKDAGVVKLVDTPDLGSGA